MKEILLKDSFARAYNSKHNKSFSVYAIHWSKLLLKEKADNTFLWRILGVFETDKLGLSNDQFLMDSNHIIPCIIDLYSLLYVLYPNDVN